MKQEIVNCLVWYTNQMAAIAQYSAWSNEFCRKEVKENTDKFLKEIKDLIDWENLTEEEACELRFMKFNMGTEEIWLIPLYLFPIIPKGIELTSILGDTFVYTDQELDNDTRLGCVAYGIRVKKDKGTSNFQATVESVKNSLQYFEK